MLRWNGTRRRVEKGPAHDQRIRVADGHGGLWAVGEDIWTGPDQLSHLYHRTAKGAWTTRTMSADGLRLRANDLVRFPGTAEPVGVGSTTHLMEEYGRIFVSR
ncbi:hypothetical protein EDD29_8371 [Actinocorallia herbida]|uniref:Uncharacterized protein n=1 Tax=Actinocorallia herbida TaxID=58109 RepID=A0A3N1DBZ7_9ACTN|nr:hypothetical protein [Actinocorallia herbida]ROO90638.1 hypothetical protein EDD29_8371 [Actinocorallia herbida]